MGDMIDRDAVLAILASASGMTQKTINAIRALPAAPAEDVRAGALREAAKAWEAFKAANTTVDHWKAVERLNAALEAKP